MRGTDLHNKLKTIELKGEKINFTELARLMGFNNVQALYSKLKAKRLDDDFVKDVAKKLGIDYRALISTDFVVVDEDDEEYKTKSVNADSCLQMLIDSQQEQIRLHKKMEVLQDELLSIYRTMSK